MISLCYLCRGFPSNPLHIKFVEAKIYFKRYLRVIHGIAITYGSPRDAHCEGSKRQIEGSFSYSIICPFEENRFALFRGNLLRTSSCLVFRSLSYPSITLLASTLVIVQFLIFHFVVFHLASDMQQRRENTKYSFMLMIIMM